MSKYLVSVPMWAFASVTVEADDANEAIERAFGDGLPSICAHCSGWGKSYSLELDDGDFDKAEAEEV